MRTFGVEEEFLLVDPATGNHAPVADKLFPVPAPGSESGMEPASRQDRQDSVAARHRLTYEVQREQLEAVSAPFSELGDLASAIRMGRAEANRQAISIGARAVAVGTSPLPVLPNPVRLPRYMAMEERFGLILREQLMCGFHIHVAVGSDEEAVGVLDRIRIWLPVLIALSGNSPFWQGKDTGYASFRYQIWRRWPTSGPTEIFGSGAAYKDLLEMLLSCNVLLDQAMVYFDARISASYPTVEVRVPDVCTEADHAIALAAITRALVETAAREWATGKPPQPVPAEMLRLASWRASRFALDDDLIHPLQNRPQPATSSMDALVSHIRPVLDETGDLPWVQDVLHQILRTGTGARRQRAVMRRTGSFRHVILDAAERTIGTKAGP
jgi:carboxylate-amine ligase